MTIDAHHGLVEKLKAQFVQFGARCQASLFLSKLVKMYKRYLRNSTDLIANIKMLIYYVIYT